MCDEEYVPAWKRVEEANETQKAAWGMSARAILNRYNCALNLPYMVSVICHDAGVKLENYGKVSLQVQRFLRESPDFKLTMGQFGGIAEVRLGCPPTPIVVVPAMPSRSTPVDNYTCGCGNSKLSTETDKSCWKCGELVVKP